MELSKFIKEAVLEAVKGIEEAREESEALNKGVNEFCETGTVDIEVTVLCGADGEKLVGIFGMEGSEIKIKLPVKLEVKG